MNNMRTLLLFCLLLLVITSCDTSSKRDLITGKWTFDKFELPKNFPPGSVPDIDEYNNANRGLEMTFLANGEFTTAQRGGPDFNNRSGHYQLIADDKLLLGEDTIKIVQLEQNVLRLFKDDESPVVVFRRK